MLLHDKINYLVSDQVRHKYQAVQRKSRISGIFKKYTLDIKATTFQLSNNFWSEMNLSEKDEVTELENSHY